MVGNGDIAARMVKPWQRSALPVTQEPSSERRYSGFILEAVRREIEKSIGEGKLSGMNTAARVLPACIQKGRRYEA